MNKNYIRMIAAALTIAVIASTGCVFNANRITTQKSGEISSTNLRIAAIVIDDVPGDITINSGTSSSIRATVTVSEITLVDKADNAADGLSVGIDTLNRKGNVAFSYPSTDSRWEQLRVESIVLDVDSTLNVEAHNTNGSITATGIHDSMSFETTNGSISADVQKKFTGKTVNGRINLTVTADSLRGNINAETTNGSISISVPRGAKARLNLETTNGDRKCPAGNNSSLNSGGAYTIYCRTTNGNITIVER